MPVKEKNKNIDFSVLKNRKEACDFAFGKKAIEYLERFGCQTDDEGHRLVNEEQVETSEL